MKKTLTNREVEILTLLSTGLLYKEIAFKMNIKLDTVKKHCQNIYKKLNSRNAIEAVIWFNEHNKTTFI